MLIVWMLSLSIDLISLRGNIGLSGSCCESRNLNAAGLKRAREALRNLELLLDARLDSLNMLSRFAIGRGL